MARCARRECGTWRPDVLAKQGGVGVVLEHAWYCSRRCVERAAAERIEMARSELPPPAPRPIPPLKLGMLLVHQGVVTPVKLAAALDAQRKTGHRLGQQLQDLAFVSQPELLRALAAQSGAPWLPVLDPKRVRNVPSALGPSVVRALGLVPFEVETARHRVKVACAAPVPRLALRALTELTGWVADPFIVADDALPELLSAYENGVEVRQSSGVLGVLTPYAAATRIAQVASAGRETRLAHARCDPYLWVRVENGSEVDDLIVGATDTKEQSWQAAPTLH